LQTFNRSKCGEANQLDGFGFGTPICVVRRPGAKSAPRVACSGPPGLPISAKCSGNPEDYTVSFGPTRLSFNFWMVR
jgi:hypothetical protein